MEEHVYMYALQPSLGSSTEVSQMSTSTAAAIGCTEPHTIFQVIKQRRDVRQR